MMMPVVPLHEAIASEFRDSPTLQAPIDLEAWPPAYRNHPLVLKAQRHKQDLPRPLALYLDAVRFTAPLAGRTDSALGIGAFSIQTQRRHLLCAVRTKDFCICGGRGWDTLWPLLHEIAWSAKCLARGVRPATGSNGQPFNAGHPCMRLFETLGPTLGFSGIFLWYKGDWAEAVHSFGLPAVTSSSSPCPFCKAHKRTLHVHYPMVSEDDWPWLLREEDYNAVCEEREVHVVVHMEG